MLTGLYPNQYDLRLRDPMLTADPFLPRCLMRRNRGNIPASGLTRGEQINPPQKIPARQRNVELFQGSFIYLDLR